LLDESGKGDGMSKANDGGAAFPFHAEVMNRWDEGTHTVADFTGMTLRDYFAAAAMGAIIGREDTAASSEAHVPQLHSDVSRFAYGLADAMLKAREQ
jgi:hypothetical protein